MTPFVRVSGVAAPLLQNNIDTDQITPGHTGMKVAKTGFGAGLFFNWRYLEGGGDNPTFILNQPPFRQASFIIAGVNFGCGSSREFAVFALRDFGIRAIIAPSFGAIFTSNCYVNGVLPIILAESETAELAASVTAEHPEITIDLEACRITGPLGTRYAFDVPALRRAQLLEGLNAIDATKKRDHVISAFQERDRAKRPWIYPSPR